ncbi:unnamed protein product [Mucor hiemalis]
MSHTLPFEILKKTFSALSDEDLQECRVTCKQWNQPALEQMRETFCFYNVSEESAPEMIEILEKASPEILGQVKHINLDLTKEPRDEDSTEPVFYWDVDDLLKTVLKLCPNITKISSSTPPPMSEIWDCIKVAVNEGHLQHLESIPTPFDEDMAFEYFPIAKAIKSRLKKMCIYNNFVATDSIRLEVFDPSNCKNGPFSDPWLQEYPKLEELSFAWYCVEETLLDCDAMIENCSNSLKSVELFIRPLMNIFKEDSVSLLPHAVQPRSNVKHFTCSWEMIKSDSIALYLMEKFPCLDSFTLEMNSNGWRRHEKLSETVLASFMHYLSRISALDLGFFLPSNKVKSYLTPFALRPEVKIVHQSNIVDDYEKVVIQRSAKNQEQDTCKITIFTSNPMEYSSENVDKNWKIV